MTRNQTLEITQMDMAQVRAFRRTLDDRQVALLTARQEELATEMAAVQRELAELGRKPLAERRLKVMELIPCPRARSDPPDRPDSSPKRRARISAKTLRLHGLTEAVVKILDEERGPLTRAEIAERLAKLGGAWASVDRRVLKQRLSALLSAHPDLFDYRGRENGYALKS